MTKLTEEQKKQRAETRKKNKAIKEQEALLEKKAIVLKRQLEKVRRNRLHIQPSRTFEIDDLVSLIDSNAQSAQIVEVLDDGETYKIKYSERDEYDYLPASQSLQQKLKPVYEEMDGWNEDIAGVKKISMLPDNAQKYITRLEEILEIKFDIISTSPKREDTIILRDLI